MRAAFGLVSLLVVVAVMMWIYSVIEIPTAREGKKAQDQAAQLAGRSPDGGRAMDSLTLEAQEKGGHLDAILVKGIVPNGAFQQYYGLQKGDQIIEVVGSIPVKDTTGGDGELAKAFIQEAYQKGQQLVVIRDGQQMTLPAGPARQTPAEQILNGTAIPTH